jgi:cystathionine beta-lyase/cystathionine gamma-synthase
MPVTPSSPVDDGGDVPQVTAQATLTVHGGRAAPAAGDPVVTPLVQSVNFVQSALDTDDGDALRYTRYGNTPNALLVQRRMALLEGTEDALVLASGMGATSCTMLALLRPGDHLLASSWLYGGTRELFEHELPMLGIDVSFVDPMETRGWRRRLRPNTRVLFLESPVNPTTRVLDLRPLSTLSLEHGLALVVDATFASPINMRATTLGADVVIHSSTKYLNGHHDALGGVVCGTQAVVDEVRRKMTRWGQAADPFAVWLLERGLKTLDVRVQRQNANALRIAEWASTCAAVEAVLYPGLASHPDHAIACEQLRGFGGMLGVVVRGGADAAQRAIARLRLFTHAASLGGVDSLVSEPRRTSHRHLSAAQRSTLGIPDGFLRLSIGIEHPDDLIADLSSALDAS